MVLALHKRFRRDEGSGVQGSGVSVSDVGGLGLNVYVQGPVELGMYPNLNGSPSEPKSP